MTWRRRVVIALGVGAMGWALGGEWVSIRQHVPESHFVDLLTGLAFLAGGIVALDRRPGNALGVLMLAFGFVWYLRNWGDSGVSWLPLLGTVSGFAGPPLLAQIMLAYPAGRLRSGFDRVVVGLVYAVAASGCAVTLLRFGASGGGCVRCQWEPALFPSRAAYQQLAAIYVPASLALAVLVVIAAQGRWRRATRAERRDLAVWWIPLRLVGVVFVLGAFGSPLPDGNSFPYLLWELQSLLLAGLPAVLVWGLLSARLARSAVGDLVLELRRPLRPGQLGESLARAIGDPSAELRYRRNGQHGWVDAIGQPAALSLETGRSPIRAVTIVERDSRPLAALLHDPALDSGLVRAAAAAAGMAIENERLQAEVRAQLAEVRASRQRIVEAGDRERRRVERNLHDGAQQRLATLALTLAVLGERERADPEVAEALARASAELRQAIAELRELARGIHPAVLTEDGLAAAVESLADRSAVPARVAVGIDVRLPEPVETAAYFVVAESLANVAKHARASIARVELSRCDGTLRVEVADDGIGGASLDRGTGLRGLEDRILALSGRFRVESARGGGTRVVAEIPC